ncbi:MAG: AAA family ATPase [Treponema sp.]|nr:AAA family ATPase [Treponema sp.]
MSKRKSTAIYDWNKNQLYKLLYGLYHTKVPTMIWGNPGGGKTSTVNFIGKNLNVPTVIRSGNKSDPVDFSGVPYLIDCANTEGGKALRYSEPKYVQIMKESPNGILFFDEITTCSPVIQVALLSIIQDCQFGEFEIPKSIYRVAAGNYNNITGTHNMSLALMNRFCHIFYDMNMEFFLDGFISGWQNYENCKINNSNDQIDKNLNYRLAVTNFLKQHPDLLNSFPADGAVSDPHEFAYPTPRSWEMIVKILSVLDGNEGEYIQELVKGCIGETTGNFFLKFLEDHKGLEIEIPSFVGKEDKFRLPYPDRHDHVYQIMASMVYYLEQDPKKYMELWIHVINVLHNEDNKYGNYASYDGLIMKYLFSNIKLLLDTGILLPSDIKDFSKKIPCYNLLGLIGG